MKFYQHVYGRVSKGYRSGLQGYQLAALTDELAERLDLVEQLNRFSFFNLRNGTGAEERFSFYRPVSGFLAFGCSRLARDRTGSTGWFAHHYICEEEGFLNSLISPPRVLQELNWLKNEKELPPDRSLEAIEFPADDSSYARGGGTEPALASRTWRSFALQILDMLMGKPLPVVPLVVASDPDAWAILSELFYLAPRQEASRLGFSTLFAEASDFIEAYRLVFVPDERHVPSGTYVYRVARAGEAFNPAPPPLFFSSIWREHEEAAPSLVRFIDLIRQGGPHLGEAGGLLPGLLAIGKGFRDCVEQLGLHIYDLLLRDENWIVAYARAGSEIRYRDISNYLWSNTGDGLIPLLKASTQLRAADLAEHALTDLAFRVTTGQVRTSILTQLEEANYLPLFYQTVTRSLKARELIELISRVRTEHFYGNELHRILAHLILAGLARGDRGQWVESLRWLHGEADVRASDRFVDAVVGFGVWVHNKRRDNFELRDYPLSSSDYLTLAQQIWISELNRVATYRLCEMVLDPRYVPELLGLISRQFTRYDADLQKSVLNVIAQRFGSQAAANPSLLEAIRLSDDPRELARSFRRQLLRSHPTISADELGALTRLEDQGRRRFLSF